MKSIKRTLYLDPVADKTKLDLLREYNEQKVSQGMAFGEIEPSTNMVSLTFMSHKITGINITTSGEVNFDIELLDTDAGQKLQTISEHIDFEIRILSGFVVQIYAIPKKFPGIFFPHQWDQFPFEDKNRQWHIHRMSEHHNQPTWMHGFDRDRFIIAEGRDVFIVPESIQRIFEFFLRRGRAEQAKMVGLIMDELTSFKDIDIINPPHMSVDEKYLFPHNFKKQWPKPN